jgi:hypothetical protein
MVYVPYMHLQALRDFSAFQFTSAGPAGPVTRQVRFNGQRDNGIYNLDLRDLPVTKKDGPGPVSDQGDMNTVLATLVQVIELYTERYPRRTVRLKGDTQEKAHLYRMALEHHLDILCPLFMIEMEEHISAPGGIRSIDNIAFRLKRKPIPFLTFQTIQTTWSGHSRLFGSKVAIEVEKAVRVGIALPMG